MKMMSSKFLAGTADSLAENIIPDSVCFSAYIL